MLTERDVGRRRAFRAFRRDTRFGVGPNDGKDVIGVFAIRDLAESEVVLVDKSRLWVSLCMNSGSCIGERCGKCEWAFANLLDRAVLVLEQRRAAW